MTMFLAPYTAIADVDGSPLDAGFLFFGEYGKDPELFPIEVFWDDEFTVPAAQPIRTRNGYPVRNGSPTKVYLKTAQHSIVIKNRNSAFILVDFKNKGWDASFVVSASGQAQQEINDYIGADWRDKAGGYGTGDRVRLLNGDIVKSTIPNNMNNPNTDMAGWAVIEDYVPHARDYGAIGDGLSHPLSERYLSLEDAQAQYPFATSLAQEIDACAVQKMVNEHSRYNKMSVDGLNLYFGTVSSKTALVTIENPVQLDISGVCQITALNAGAYCNVFAVKNPIKFKSHGIKFFDPTYDEVGNIGGTRNGVIGFSFVANGAFNINNKCGDIDVIGSAENCLAHISFDGVNQTGMAGGQNFYAIDTAKVISDVKTCYYGVMSPYGCTNIDLSITTENVRRAFISYGQKGLKLNVKAANTANFVGSNGFVELACEGDSAVNPATGVLTNIEVEDFDINVEVSGVEAHEGIVNMYHQRATQYGSMKLGKINVVLKNLTTTGKAAGLGNLDAVVFTHESAGAVKPTTDRGLSNVSINVVKEGSISGSPFAVRSVPNNKDGVLTLGEGLIDALPKTPASLMYFKNFKAQGKIEIPQSPIFYGSTTAGTMTKTKSRSALRVVNQTATYILDEAWSAFDGAGGLRAAGLSLARSANSYCVSQTGLDAGFSGVLSASLEAGTLDNLYFYIKSTVNGAAGLAPCNNAAEIRMSVEFKYK